MNASSKFVLAGFGILGSVLGVAPEARAEFLVICPTSTRAEWFGAAEGITTRVSTGTDQLEGPLPRPTTLLSCFHPFNLEESIFASFETQETCRGGAQFIGNSAVFGRSEVFVSENISAIASIGVECTLEIPLDGIQLNLLMTEPCQSNSDNSWTCPDSSFPITP